MKVMLRGKFLSLSVYIKELGSSHTSNLTEHLKTLEQKQEIAPKRSKWQEKIKFRAEINKTETTKQYKEYNGVKSWFFEKNQ